MSFIELENLKKYYNPNTNLEVQALKNINLKIEKGDFCSILGVSGSGKSTLLYILGCIDKQTEGIYKLDGEEVSKLSEKNLADIRNKKIGFVLQDFGLIEDETVTENILVPTLFNSIKNVNIKLEEILNKLEIGDLRNKKVSMLSGGQRQRVAIARALITNPELILADEPTGSLDSITTIHIMNIFEQLNKEGKTIIIVTHNLELAKKTKKCFTIKDGLIYKA
ncbi:MAG: ABC transporter ATP-binding protein [Clostridium sp.]|jgi:putative ABC transport system ATP-binding protein|nr:ABC transporter ATP-binding protein [Clostridium sp.]